MLKSARMMRSALASFRFSTVVYSDVQRVVHANYTLALRTYVPYVLSVAAITIMIIVIAATERT